MAGKVESLDMRRAQVKYVRVRHAVITRPRGLCLSSYMRTVLSSDDDSSRDMAGRSILFQVFVHLLQHPLAVRHRARRSVRIKLSLWNVWLSRVHPSVPCHRVDTSPLASTWTFQVPFMGDDDDRGSGRSVSVRPKWSKCYKVMTPVPHLVSAESNVSSIEESITSSSSSSSSSISSIEESSSSDDGLKWVVSEFQRLARDAFNVSIHVVVNSKDGMALVRQVWHSEYFKPVVLY